MSLDRKDVGYGSDFNHHSLHPDFAHPDFCHRQTGGVGKEVN
jgi:hypothetical protein